jgi:hypothetical protein
MDGPLQITVFCSSLIFNMAARANNVLWLAEISKFLFSETNELTEPKLYMNDHWKALYQVTVFLCQSEIQDGSLCRT